MKDLFWNDEWPNLNSISIALFCPELSAEEFGVLYRFVWFIASCEVNSAHSDALKSGFLPTDTQTLCRIAGVSEKKLSEISPQLEQYFRRSSRGLELIDKSVIRLSKSTRAAIPTSTLASVNGRDGEFCVYCGSTEGPFHKDHLWPVSKGGSNDACNIVTACARCNLSKGAKTLMEWFQHE